jgi:hypothetical protein
MIPNHGLISSACSRRRRLPEGPDDRQHLRWDTDCNSGNVGCLMGIKNGLAGLDTGQTIAAGGRPPSTCPPPTEAAPSATPSLRPTPSSTAGGRWPGSRRGPEGRRALPRRPARRGAGLPAGKTRACCGWKTSTAQPDRDHCLALHYHGRRARTPGARGHGHVPLAGSRANARLRPGSAAHALPRPNRPRARRRRSGQRHAGRGRAPRAGLRRGRRADAGAQPQVTLSRRRRP